MKKNMLNKVIDWVERKGPYLMDWIYNKKPKNKYLRVAYYFLTGLIYFMFIILLILIGICYNIYINNTTQQGEITNDYL